MRWWLRLWRNGHEAEQKALQAAKELERVRRQTPMIKDVAAQMSRLPADELVERVSRAFRRRPA